MKANNEVDDMESEVMRTQRLMQKGAFEIHKLLQQAPDIINDVIGAAKCNETTVKLNNLEKILMEADGWAKALSDT